MKNTKHIILAILCIFFCTSELLSKTNKEQILAIRNASNLVLKSHEKEEVLSYLTDDVLTTTGNGILLSGKEALKKYIFAGAKSEKYFVRETKEIILNEKRGLAWENAIWKGYYPRKSDESIVNGNYSAVWIKESNS
jgi:hypothetical protein